MTFLTKYVISYIVFFGTPGRKNLEFSSSKCHTLDTMASLTGITIQRCVLALLKYIYFFTLDWLFFDNLQRHLLSLPPFYNLHQFHFGSFLEGTGVDFNFWVFFISILVITMLTKLFCVLTVTFFVQGGCNLTHPNKTKTKTIGFDTIEINLVHVLFSI